HMAMGQWAIEQLEAPEGRGRYPITKLECPLVERESVATFKGLA
ncbi:MAG: LacI family transcriptional regulator, partial [Mesorhizobium sp.]